jgi:phosphatidate cytidylyltransferase
LSELTKRIFSGIVLAAVLLGDLWLGSWWYLALLLVGGALVLIEFERLVRKMALTPVARGAWIVFGVIYVGLALHGLWRVRAVPEDGLFLAAWLFLIVWATDIGAYVFGRTIGGPKIAPAISPSKTWAGLLGGCVFVGLVMVGMTSARGGLASGVFAPWVIALVVAALGIPLAVLAQAGDFFESWMKRRAGVKDSGALIPGHGGIFDRVDGLLPVAIVFLPFMEWSR